jgi:LCP family protein required for cell wall assembly
MLQPTPPYYPVQRRPRRRYLRRRRFGCGTLGCLALVFAPLSCISACLLLYVLFPPSPTDILLMGMDARPGQGYETRSDSIMLLNVTPGRMKVSLMSIPRDVFIWVPGYGEQRINTINVLGEAEIEGTTGPDLLKASLNESFGVDVENYVRLDFNGFVALVDAVGGVDIDVPKQIIDYEYPTLDGGIMTVQFDPGHQHMDGERALQYARTRHQDSDYQRAARQQQVIDAIISKLSNPLYVVYWPGALNAIRSNTDTDLSAWDMARLGPAMLIGWRSKTVRVLEGDDLIGMKAGYWVPDYDQLSPWIEEHFD